MPTETIQDLPSFRAAISTPLKLIVVDFHATWCGPCHAIAPVYATLSDEYAGRARFLKVDVDEAEDVARFSGVSAMPTFHFYANGSRVAEFSGADPAKLRDHVQRFAPSAADVSFAGAGQKLGQGSASTDADADSMRVALAKAAARRMELSRAEKDDPEKDDPEKEEKADGEKRDEEMSEDVAGAEAAQPEEEKNGEEGGESAPTAQSKENDTRLKVNETYLSQLVDEMGFPKIRAEKALILTGNNSVEQAVEWCFQHADDADIDEPLQIVTSEGEAKPKLSPEEAKRRADELYARARAKREEEERKTAKEREKQRIRSGKEVAAAKQKLDDEARKRAIEEKKREKREALLERQRVKQMLEADKARRREKFRMPGAAGPAPEPVQEPPKAPPREPTSSAGKIQFRLPDGSRIEGEFQAEHTMGDLVTFIVEKRPELGVHALQFSQQYPRKTFSNSEFGISLAELKLLPRGALTVSFS